MYVSSSLKFKGGVAVAVKETWLGGSGGGLVVRVDGVWGEVRACFIGVYMPADSNTRVKVDFPRDVLLYHFCGLPLITVMGGDCSCVI